MGVMATTECNTSEGCSSKDVLRRRSRPSRPILLGSKCSCWLLRIVQDAHPPLKLRLFVDDITAFVNERNKESVQMVETVL